jgi:uncharacterized protein YaaR (DUF327 family)
MPDIFIQFNKHWQQSKDQISNQNSRTLQSFSKGIEHHYLVDDFFHLHPWFLDQIEEYGLRIRALEDLSHIKKSHTLIHIFIEVVIDHFLVLKYQNELALKYDTLSQIPIALIEDILKALGYSPELIQENLNLYQIYLSKKYLMFYADFANLYKPLFFVTNRFTNFKKEDFAHPFFKEIYKEIIEKTPDFWLVLQNKLSLNK